MPRKTPKSQRDFLGVAQWSKSLRHQRWLEPQKPTDLERIEGLLGQLAFEMQTTRVVAARVIRALDIDRRDAVREQKNPKLTAKIRVGSEREKQIRRLLARAGWSLREVVDRKLPLTRLRLN